MGEYFSYVNHTKRQQFSIGLASQNNKSSGIGRTLGARAFGLLITRSDHLVNVFGRAGVGYWEGDLVACCGDESACHVDWTEYVDIDANAVSLLYRVDRSEYLVEWATESDFALVELAHLAKHAPFPALEADLRQAIGDEYDARLGEARVSYPGHLHALVRDVPW